MPNSKIFCSVPWFEVHVNADGTYHTCGAQRSPGRMPFPPGWTQTHNVFNMQISEWVNSEYQRQVRLDKLSGVTEPRCAMCYNDEVSGSSSKRINENHKSQITADQFELTFVNSPDHARFDYSLHNQGQTDVVRPVSYHLSLGNECNYACKMCGPWASSQLAVEGLKNGTYSGPARLNWTTDNAAWTHITDYICATENLQFVHLIGGEPYMNPRFEALIDLLLEAGRTDIYLGFTTNGSMVNAALIKKLNAFRHVDIGVSIECMGALNDAIRKGTKTQGVLDNIDTYLKYRKESHVYVTVRPVPSALSVHTLYELYEWCVGRGVDVMTNILTWPEHLQIRQLPKPIKDRLLDKYSQWKYSEPMPGVGNPRDPNRFREHIDSEIRAVIHLLQQENDPATTQKLYNMIEQWGWKENSEISRYFDC